MHQDAMGTANCGEGFPMWFTQKHFPHLIGKPIVGLPSKNSSRCSLTDFASWQEHAGDPNYNLKNPCCVKINIAGREDSTLLDTSDLCQASIVHLASTAEGRSAYGKSCPSVA